jgi:hypothetical protein
MTISVMSIIFGGDCEVLQRNIVCLMNRNLQKILHSRNRAVPTWGNSALEFGPAAGEGKPPDRSLNQADASASSPAGVPAPEAGSK